MKRKMTSAAVYATTSLALAVFWDSLYGAGPFTGYIRLIHLAIVGTALILTGCIASLFAPRVGEICGLAGSLLAWPCFAIQLPNIPWRELVSVLPYANWLYLLIAILTLVVATIYSLIRLWPFFRGRPDAAGHMMGLKLAAALLYVAGTSVLINWHEIWDFLFRLRYGN